MLPPPVPSPYDPPQRPAPQHASSSGGFDGGAKVQFTNSAYGDDNLSTTEVPLVGYQYQPGGGRLHPGHVQPVASTSAGAGGAANGADFKRKKSLVRPDRERVDESHRLYNYRQHAAEMEAEGRGTAAVSRTGHYASAGLPIPVTPAEVSGRAVGPGIVAASHGLTDSTTAAAKPNLRRGKSILAREEGTETESGLNLFKRSGTTRRRAPKGQQALPGGAYEQNRRAKKAKSKPMSPWMIYCQIITACLPTPLLKCFGVSSHPDRSPRTCF